MPDKGWFTHVCVCFRGCSILQSHGHLRDHVWWWSQHLECQWYSCCSRRRNRWRVAFYFIYVLEWKWYLTLLPTAHYSELFLLLHLMGMDRVEKCGKIDGIFDEISSVCNKTLPSIVNQRDFTVSFYGQVTIIRFAMGKIHVFCVK